MDRGIVAVAVAVAVVLVVAGGVDSRVTGVVGMVEAGRERGLGAGTAAAVLGVGRVGLGGEGQGVGGELGSVGWVWECGRELSSYSGRV
jgi:hypothetical protein